MKSISFVQVNYPSNFEGNRYYLPYSIGQLWAYVDSFKTNLFKLDKIIFRRESLSELSKKLAFNDVIAFSCYIWNREYCLNLAKRIKEITAKVKIIFGGPELEVTDINFFTKYPFIDIHVINEGEITFKDVLDNINDVSSVEGIIWNDKGKTVFNKNRPRINNLTSLPSPYLSGVFDSLIADHPGFEWTATLETNRGCPYQCTFCDWGSLTYSKVRKFELEKIYSEIEWVFKDDTITAVDLADANFGIFVERDSSIVDYIIEQKEITNKKIAFNTNFAKNQNKAVVGMVRKLAKHTDSSNFHVVALQSLDDVVLTNIKRKNLDSNNIEEIYKIAIDNDLSLKVELILGLPGDTLESFKKTIYKVYDLSPEIAIQIYKLQGLNNSELFLSNNFGIRWKNVKNYEPADEEDVAEYIKQVFSTETMDNKDLLEALCFSSWIIAFHSFGLSNIIAAKAKKLEISYEEFYEKLYEVCKQDKYIKKYFNDFKQHNLEWYNNQPSTIKPINNIKFNSHRSLWYFISKIHGDNSFDHIFSIVEKYAKSIGLEDSRLFNIQRNVPIRFETQHRYPLALENNSVQLINKNKLCDSKEQFINDLYFKREVSFGKAIIKEDTRVA